MTDTIAPHGGKLVNCISQADENPEFIKYLNTLIRVPLNEREHSDLELIAVGALSPLDGFMTEAEHKGVVNDMRLPNGLVWSIPVNLAVDAAVAEKIKLNHDIALADAAGKVVGLMRVTSKYASKWDEEAQKVNLTTDEKHPGTAYIKARKPVLLGGPVQLLHARPPEFPKHHRTPDETRALFRELGWQTVVAFQTHNPIHRAHEFLTKCALELVDGLLIHPLVGETKSDDIPAPVRMRCYEALVEKYYPKDRVALTVLPAAVRYAGPREAIHHALMRKNYGCTHFIVGRDHAGVGNYYGTYDAQKMFDRFKPEEIGIVPMKFEHTFWHTGLKEMVSNKTSPGPKEAHLALSGTKVREMLAAGQDLPPEFTRPEVSKILMEFYKGK